MLTGRKFLLLALVVGLCALTTTGCKRRRSSGTTINNSSSIFTTDNFPGGSVQDGNVSDDQRAFSTFSDSFNGGTLVCTHNGSRGTIMVTYICDGQIFAHYYDGANWTPGVTLRHPDVITNTTTGSEIVHAWINTGNDDRTDASDRDGDCMIFWNALDLDSDGTGVENSNQVLYMTYFDVSHSGDASNNFGFDVDTFFPGFFDANRISSLDVAPENVEFQILVTDGLCGEARWQDGGNVYSYGDDTSAIFVAYRMFETKAIGVNDEVTVAVGFNLAGVVDEEAPLLASLDAELAISTFGASDSGASSTESEVGEEYSSYNFILGYRVISETGASFTGTPIPGYSFASFPGTDVDITMQTSFFDPVTFTINNEVINKYIPSSVAATSADDMNSGFATTQTGGFLGSTGLTTFGSDEGLSCYVTFFGETRDADETTAPGYLGDGNENHVMIAELSETTGNYLNGAENPQLDFNDVDPTTSDNVDPRWIQAQISRNGDYIWVAYAKVNSLGASDDFNPEFVQYLTTRLDSDGLPVVIPLLTTTLGTPFIYDVEDGSSSYNWQMFQDNLGYICGQQSNAQMMHFFWNYADSATGDSLIYTVTLTADVDGAIGGETASAASLLIDEDVTGFHDVDGNGVNFSHSTFNATDAGQDGDIFYVFTFDDAEAVTGLSDVFISAGRFGVTSAAPILIGSGVNTRQAQYDGDPLILVSTPAGSNIGSFDPVDGYDSQAHHGPEEIHVIFREAETASLQFTPGAGGNTQTGYALRTRTYETNDLAGTFGDDFVPNAGSAFVKPFDLDLPFMDPDSFDDAEIMDVLVCDQSTVIIFEENGHLYYQEWDSNGNGNNIGWRQSSDDISDPALIDDDTPELIVNVEAICRESCTCCFLDGTAIFWTKELDVNTSIDRLQVRVIDRSSDNH